MKVLLEKLTKAFDSGKKEAKPVVHNIDPCRFIEICLMLESFSINKDESELDYVILGDCDSSTEKYKLYRSSVVELLFNTNFFDLIYVGKKGGINKVSVEPPFKPEDFEKRVCEKKDLVAINRFTDVLKSIRRKRHYFMTNSDFYSLFDKELFDKELCEELYNSSDEYFEKEMKKLCLEICTYIVDQKDRRTS